MTNLLINILKSKSLEDLNSINNEEKFVEAYADIQCFHFEYSEINNITKTELLELSLGKLVPFSHIFSFDDFGSFEEHIHDRAQLPNGTYVHSKKGLVIGTMRDQPLISFADSESIYIMEDDLMCSKAFDNVTELAKVMIILSVMLLKNIDMQDFEDACLAEGVGMKNIHTFKKIKAIDEV